MSKLRAFLVASSVIFALGLSLSAIILRTGGSAAEPPQGESGAAGPQHQILADGTVDAPELEQAVFAMMACLDDRGIPHSDPVLDSDGYMPQWNYTVGPYSDAEALRVNREEHECFVAHLRDVQGAWADQHAPSAEEQLAREQDVVDCANERGVPVADFDAFQAVLPTLSGEEQLTAMRCMSLGMTGVNHFD